MSEETLKFLNVQKNEWFIDCNIGGGGHAGEILRRGGRVLGVDLDKDAIEEVAANYKLKIINTENNRLKAFSENLILVQGNFADIDRISKAVSSKTGPINVSGVLFDLGVSSHQFDDINRGFSLTKEAPLDMRMDRSGQMVKAADLVNGLHERELAELFWKLGEEKFARGIARAIIKARQSARIETTIQLTRIVASAKKGRSHIHPATRVFQALRIAVNDELNNLKEALPKAFGLLRPGGRLVVISFHSLEDRIAKEFVKKMEQEGRGRLLNEKPVKPGEAEIILNPRSRSAKLRAIEKQ